MDFTGNFALPKYSRRADGLSYLYLDSTVKGKGSDRLRHLVLQGESCFFKIYNLLTISTIDSCSIKLEVVTIIVHCALRRTTHLSFYLGRWKLDGGTVPIIASAFKNLEFLNNSQVPLGVCFLAHYSITIMLFTTWADSGMIWHMLLTDSITAYFVTLSTDQQFFLELSHSCQFIAFLALMNSSLSSIKVISKIA